MLSDPTGFLIDGPDGPGRVLALLDSPSPIQLPPPTPPPLTRLAGMSDEAHASVHAFIDAVEQKIVMAGPGAEFPLRHTFLPALPGMTGMYTRELKMPRGTIATSALHKSTHPWAMSEGRMMVFEAGEWKAVEAPAHGVTVPGTRRVFIVLEPVTWTTFHATDLTDPEAVKAAITEPRTSHLAGLARPKAHSIEARSPEGDASCHCS